MCAVTTRITKIIFWARGMVGARGAPGARNAAGACQEEDREGLEIILSEIITIRYDKNDIFSVSGSLPSQWR